MPHVMVPVLCAQEDGGEACLGEPDEEWGVHGGGRAARVAAQRWGQLLRVPDLPTNGATNSIIDLLKQGLHHIVAWSYLQGC